MSVDVAMESPLAAALNEAIQPKLVEVGWATGGADDSALSEYIILMLVNGKTQEQIASELSGDLLNLGPDDPGAREFAQWLFQQVETLKQQQDGGVAQMGNTQGEHAVMGDETGAMDAEMGDVQQGGDNNVPTGPKSMRNGANRGRDKRMFGQMAKAMDRANDSILHRVGQHGAGRINTHARGGPPTGPRIGQGLRGGARPMNGRPMGMPGMMGAGGAAAGVMNMSPQQQMELYAMLEQQSQMMAQMFTPQQQQAMMMGRGGPMPAGMGRGGFGQQQGKSLFDRVQGQGRGRGQHNGGFNNGPHNGKIHKPNESGMDVDASGVDALSPDTTCKFNLSCTNKDCKFAHQSPAAPPGTAIDVSDTCSFGAACKNRKCTARHPSPAQKIAHQVEQDCKFFPNCTNPRCPFRHPTNAMPLCRNGADCTTPDCKFTHVQTKCKFNPCLNPSCTFKHEEGQKRGRFADKVWTADGSKEHVSERKFVDENDATEELILPGSEHAMQQDEVIT